MVAGDATSYDGDAWHPLMLMWLLQSALALIACKVSVHAPKALLAVVILSSLVYPVSYALGEPIWYDAPGSFNWMLVLLKWAFVNVLAAGPLLCILSFKLSDSAQSALAVLMYVVLGMNVAWTWSYPTPLGTQKVNFATAVVLMLSLAVHCAALRRRGIPLAHLDASTGVFYGRGTTLSWLVCYSVWNALFAGSNFSLYTSLNTILFWCSMVQLYYESGQARPVEDYFIHVRPIQLGMYITVSHTCGQIPYFKDAEDVQEPLGDHPYYLFLCCVNLLYGLLVLEWSVLNLIDTNRPLRKFDSDSKDGAPSGEP